LEGDRREIVYKKLYYQLFNAVTDSLSAMDLENYGQARQILMNAQQTCEELYLQLSPDEEE